MGVTMKLGSLRSMFVALVFPVLFCSSVVAQVQKETPPPKSASDISVAPSQTSAQTTQKPPETEQEQTEPSKPTTPADPRQAQLLVDTQKLYQLTQELKAEVAKSNKDTLSIAVIKKAEAVEKLAKSLKERMKAAQ